MSLLCLFSIRIVNLRAPQSAMALPRTNTYCWRAQCGLLHSLYLLSHPRGSTFPLCPSGILNLVTKRSSQVHLSEYCSLLHAHFSSFDYIKTFNYQKFETRNSTTTMLPRTLYLLLPFSSLAFSVVITEIVEIKTVTIVNAPAAPTSNPAANPPPISHAASNPSNTYTSNSDFIDSVLNSTNTFRKEHNVSPLSWNDTLANYAAQHASGCVFQHTHGPYGENLAAGYASIEAAVDGWGNERALYNFANGGFGEQTGHFSQLVWKATTSVGCGRVYCNKDGTPGWYLMCEYYPPVSYSFSASLAIPARLETQMRTPFLSLPRSEADSGTFRVMS